ncbi:MAG: homoserine kinase [Desulfovibrionaceae bacterium]|nr:homoserine kinase [Desulfovibrionaceae bacterium]
MAETVLFKRAEKAEPCVTLIGMAGSGKSTIGHALARHLGYAFMDTDHLMEAAYAVNLQGVTEALPGSAFLDMEERFVRSVRAGRCVIATGGSVVYRDAAMQHLRSLGPIVCLDCSLAVIQKRIALNPKRGLVIAPGQTIADLYNERYVLYNRYADIHCDTTKSPEACAAWIAEHLPWPAEGRSPSDV